MSSQIIEYTEEMVGANHPTKSDTLNRALLVEHNNDGTHKYYHTATFVDGDLAAGILTVTHNFNRLTPLSVVIWDNNNEEIDADVAGSDANSLTIDLSAYGALTGTWQVTVLG